MYVFFMCVYSRSSVGYLGRVVVSNLALWLFGSTIHYKRQLLSRQMTWERFIF